MTVPVSDSRSNANDQMAHAAKVIGRSKDRAAVFREIHRGKKRIKSASEIAKAIQIPRKRVLEEGVRLAKEDVVKQTKLHGETAYERDNFFSSRRDQILRLAGNPSKLARLPTKVSPSGRSNTVSVVLPRTLIQTDFVTVDDIATFAKVKRIRAPQKPLGLPERDFKAGLQRILGQRGTFTDWGGEINDLYSSNLAVAIGSRRLRTAFGLKGPGTKGTLTPKKLGKNGDQIQRLFLSPADVFLVQYWDDIDQSVIHQMAEFAKAKSVSDGRKIRYGVIDGADSDRLVLAYPSAFRARRKTTNKAKRPRN